MSIPSTWRDYAKWLEGRGWVYARNGKRHMIYVAPNGRRITVSHGNGKIDRNALANAKRLEREPERR